MIPKKIKRTALGATLVAGLIGLSSCGTTTPEPPVEESSKAVADMSSAPTTASYSKPKSTKVASTPSKPESAPSTPTKPTPPAPTPSVVAGKTHLVIKGETLWDIARQYAPAKNYDTLETYVSAARKLNELPSELAPEGEVIKLPQDVVAKTDSAPKTPASADKNSYTVKTGETLWDIARANNPSGTDYDTLEQYVSATRKLNDLPSELAPAGETIKLPEATAVSAAGGDKTHAVKTGETLWDIARKQNPGASYDDLEAYVKATQKLNELPSELAPAGETIKLP